MERLEQLQALSDAATEYVISKYGRTSMKCVEGRYNLFINARKAGFKEVEKAQGFFMGRHHNWVYDPVTEAIIDPTATQFGGENGVILPSNERYSWYNAVPKEYLHHLGYQPSLQYSRWMAAKKWLLAGTTPSEDWGENKVEWRVSKKGDDYLYFQREVHFDKYFTEHVRAGLVFTTKDGGYHVTVTMQRRVLVDGKVYRPTRIKHYYVSPYGALLVSIRGKWQPFRDSQGFYHPSSLMSELPEEVRNLITNDTMEVAA